MSYKDRAIHVGGYFTAALLLINVFLSGAELFAAVLISLGAGLSFTVASLAVGRRYNLR